MTASLGCAKKPNFLTMKIFTQIVSIILVTLNIAAAQGAQSGQIQNQDTNMKTVVENDADLKIKTLANGFTIAVYKNAEPPKRVSMRLLVRRGSFTETLPQRGIAHFVEHMAFNGTANFPKGEMVEYFQRLGMAFGADTNAHTSFNETVYKIDMPENSPAILDDGLKLLSDYANKIEFSQSEIERERGVILAEKKSRDTAAYRASIGLIKEISAGSVLAERFPIGSEDVIKNANRDEFLNFYKANYRSANMALVVVGDVNADEIFKDAEKYFSNIKDPDSKPAEVLKEVFDASKYPANTVQVSEFFDADSRDSSAGIYLVSAPQFGKDCFQKRVRDFQMYAISRVINLRFDAAKSGASTKFSDAYSDFGEFEKYSEILTIAARAPAAKSPEALSEVLKMYCGIMQNGFGNWELEKAKNDIITSIESDIKAKPSRQSAAISDAVTNALSSQDAFTSPEQDLTLARAAFKDFDAAKATQLFKDYAAKSVVFARLVDAKKPSPNFNANSAFTEILTSLKQSKNLSLPLNASELQFADFSGKYELESDNTDALQIRQLVFKNNVRANLKNTDFAKDEVVINVAFGGGKYDILEDKTGLATIAIGALLGGTKFQSYDEINVAKSDKHINLSFAMEGDNFAFNCTTTSENLQESLKLLSTYMREAGFRNEALNYIKKLVENRYRQIATNPDAASVKVESWLTSQNPMFRFPSKEEVEKFTMQDLRQWLEPIMKNSYLEISIVGDFNAQDAVKWVGEYFGTMPNRAASRKDYSAKRNVKLTSEKTETINVESKTDSRSIAMLIWPTCDRSQIKKMRATNILGAILSDELRKSVREKQGKVYSPFAYNNSSRDFNFGTISAICDTAPEYNDEVAEYMHSAAKKVAKDISEDEFLRAKEPILKQVEKVRRMNSYWANSVLALYQADSARREVARTFENGYSEITLPDVKNAAAEFLKDKAPYRIKIAPEGLK